MSKPKQEVRGPEYFKEIHFLYEILASLKNVDELKAFLKDILTRSELRMLKRRWHIACLLNQGDDIRAVAQKAQVSTTTIVKMKKVLEESDFGGLRLALERAEEAKRPKRRRRRGTMRYRQVRSLLYGDDELYD